MKLVIYQELTPLDGNPETVLNYLKENLPTTRKFEGNIFMHALMDKEDSNIVRIVHQWESLEHYLEYRKYRESLGGQLMKIAKYEIVQMNYIREDV